MKSIYWKIKANHKLSIQLAKRQLSEFIYDAVNLEGVNMTLPEIQTLLEGVTVGGYKISDQQMALNQAETWKHIFKMVEFESWELSKKTACQLHYIAGKGEALEWGSFRSGNEAIVGTEYLPPDHSELNDLFSKMVDDSKLFLFS